jgi:NAD(P)-dependent dehydrogenase (short-subunit alcohol dehydrogenase family)
MDLNVKSPFFLIRVLLRTLRASASQQRPAKVINIASIDGLSVNMQDTYSYAASKVGLIHSDQAACVGAGAGRHRRLRDRPWRLRLKHEQTRARPG